MLVVGGRGKGGVRVCGRCLDGWMFGCWGAGVRCGLLYKHATLIYIVFRSRGFYPLCLAISCASL
jgi:hypothetical protein